MYKAFSPLLSYTPHLSCPQCFYQKRSRPAECPLLFQKNLRDALHVCWLSRLLKKSDMLPCDVSLESVRPKDEAKSLHAVSAVLVQNLDS
jgi:hypothetical protein